MIGKVEAKVSGFNQALYDEIMSIQDGEDMNARIARDVMGWSQVGSALFRDERDVLWVTDNEGKDFPHRFFDPSRDLHSAALLIDQFKLSVSFNPHSTKEQTVWLVDPRPAGLIDLWTASGPTLQMAVCRCVLLAKLVYGTLRTSS